jgi:two-component system, LuxR family, response regulator FixJ
MTEAGMSMGRHGVLAHEIVIVDDDATICDVLSAGFALEGFEVASFPDGESFLTSLRTHRPACVLLDVNMPGRSGLDVLKAINAPTYPAPIFVLSGRKDVPAVVDAIRYGAQDFIEKPFNVATVVNRVHAAMAAWFAARQRPGAIMMPEFPGQDRLTRREQDVLMQIAGGASNKEAARRLGISTRTVEVHRARVMAKIGAKNAADLVRIVLNNWRSH